MGTGTITETSLQRVDTGAVAGAITESTTKQMVTNAISGITADTTKRIPSGDFIGLVCHLIFQGDQGPTGRIFLEGDMTDGDDHLIFEGDEQDDRRSLQTYRFTVAITEDTTNRVAAGTATITETSTKRVIC